MGTHPLNLGLRLVLELAAWTGVGVWGWYVGHDSLRYVLALGLPMVAMALWVTFAVPDDPSRSGNAPVPTPGPVRLVLELAVFGVGATCFWAAGFTWVAAILAGLVVLHHAFSVDRIRWLWSR